MEHLQVYHPLEGEIFHVHTFRCKHAEEVPDKAYIDKAIEIGAPRIVFTDHSPFPGNPFRNRMEMEMLSEYISTMERLKEEYRGKIEILAGLEVEYLPSYREYYHELKTNAGLDLLIMGQHFFEHRPGCYNFMDEDKSDEYIGLCEAMIQGIKTNLFDVVAHPDRVFRRRKSFGSDEESLADRVIHTASFYGTYLEMNYSSMHRKHQFWYEFWNRLPRQAIVIGGAYNIDKHYRLSVGQHWFEDEQPSEEIKRYVESQLEKNNWSVDTVLSHTLPRKYIPIDCFIRDIDQKTVDKTTELWLGTIEERLSYKKWYGGHFHCDRDIDDIRIMFKRIERYMDDKDLKY